MAVTIRLVARSLNEARRQAAKRLDDSVTRALAEPPRPDSRRLIDKRELRGWPAAGRGICGATSGSRPGSDEHLERLG
jgi:hypothetical protein